MGTYNTLTSLLTAIANAIRSKTGETGQINAQDFPSKINKISITPKTQTVTKQVSINTVLGSSTETFTFSGLSTVFGVTQIKKVSDGTQGNHQSIYPGRFQLGNAIESINGNKVQINFKSHIDASTCIATWSVTAIGV